MQIEIINLLLYTASLLFILLISMIILIKVNRKDLNAEYIVLNENERKILKDNEFKVNMYDLREIKKIEKNN